MSSTETKARFVVFLHGTSRREPLGFYTGCGLDALEQRADAERRCRAELGSVGFRIEAVADTYCNDHELERAQAITPRGAS